MRLLILGTGGMANAHATNFSSIDGVTIVGGIDVLPDRLAAFSTQHKIDRQFASLEDALAWGEFDAIANVTPDRIHHPTTMVAIAAGKHVFCEKPLATDATLAMEMTEAMEKSRKVGMVNLTYRNSPALQKGREMVLAGAVGTVRHVEASHLQSWLVGNAWGDWKTESKWLWRLSKKHGSNGALGDIGIHIVDFASYGSGLDVARVFARLKTFDKAPPTNTIGEYDLDANDSFAMTVEFGNGAIGTIQATRTAAGQLDQLRLRVLRRQRVDRNDLRHGEIDAASLSRRGREHSDVAGRPVRTRRDELPALRRRCEGGRDSRAVVQARGQYPKSTRQGDGV